MVRISRGYYAVLLMALAVTIIAGTADLNFVPPDSVWKLAIYVGGLSLAGAVALYALWQLALSLVEAIMEMLDV